MSRLNVFLIVVMLSLLSAVSPARAGANAELLDYLIQDVCVNASDIAIAGDPASCGSRRNIRIGEPSPYIVTDFDRGNNNATYFAMNSFPVLGMDGTVKVMHAKSGQGNFTANYAFNFDVARDGYDFTDTTNSGYASFVRTSDGGCYDQIWSRNGSAASMIDRAGGWILFAFAGLPSNWAQTNIAHPTTYHVQLTPNRPGCQNGHSTGTTYWNAPAAYQFETYKVLTAIRSDHFANDTLSQSGNALERYYFTKEYGFTRWEAWMPQSRCFSERGSGDPSCHPENAAAYPLQGRCSIMNTSSTGIPGLDAWGGQYWVRVDCRDQTNYIAINTPMIMLDNVMAQNDGYVDIDYLAVTNPAPLGLWQASSPQIYHGSGWANGTGWNINATGQYSNLAYGPYVSGLPAGHLNATFTLMVDNNTAENHKLIDIDVYRNSDNRTFAKMTITRMQFTAANALQRFTLPFDYDGQGQLEFRVAVYGDSYVYHASSEVGY